MIEFLYFYKDFCWKNKEMIKLLETHSHYYKDRFIKIPTLYSIDEDLSILMNEKLIEFTEEIDD